MPLRYSWQLHGPYCETWPMSHVIADPASGAIYAGGGDAWFGPAVWKSPDLGASWSHSSAGLALSGGRGADQGGVERGAGGEEPLCRRRAGGAVPQRRRRRVLAPRRRPARPPVAAALAAGRRRADPALAGAAPGRRPPALGRDLLGRRVPHRGCRRDLGAAQPGHQGRLHARGPEVPRNRPVRALPGDGAGHA